jgi:hypothetical protein
MALNKDELGKMSPEERIKKLKEMEEERKKELEEASDLIKKSEAEIEREKTIPKVEVPEIERVDISKIFESHEGLEGTVRREAPKEEEQGEAIKYVAGREEEGGIASLYAEREGEAQQERVVKVEDMTKYEGILQQIDDLTASRSALKHIKKYTQG